MRQYSVRKSEVIAWGRTRAKALLARRGLREGLRVRIDRSGHAALEPLEVLDPGPGEILVRVDLSAVSPGTERAMYNRLPGVTVEPPFTPGYSGVGRVLAAGPGVTDLRPGRRVAGPFHHQTIETVAAARCHPVPDAVADQEAALVGLGIIALHGVRRSRLAWGERVLVLGRGVLGRLTAALADLCGAAEVVMAGRTDAVEPRAFDVVFDLTGNPDGVGRAALAVAPTGRILLVGSPRGDSPPFATGMHGALEIRGVHATRTGTIASAIRSWDAREEGELFLDWIGDGRLRFDAQAETILPDECWAFYRRLGRGDPPVRVALFDWRTLSDASRGTKSTLRPPRVVVPVDPDGLARALRVGRPRRSSGWDKAGRA
jgi:L-iditol 2-dehydrogenase